MMSPTTNPGGPAGRAAVPSFPVRVSQPGLDLLLLPGDQGGELSVTVRPLAGEPVSKAFARLLGVLSERQADLVQLTVFGETDAAPEGGAGALGVPDDVPLTWVAGNPCRGGPLAGIHAHAVCGRAVETLWLEGAPAGRVFGDNGLTWCYLGGLLPGDCSLSPERQARQAFERLEAALALAGMDLSHVVRTWLYLADILQWYGEFNAVRTRFFRERNVFSGLVPASTGIAGKNPAGAALLVQALAVRPAGDSNIAEALPSPLQCPALDYGSSFSRAVELRLPGSRRVLVSGTASIAQSGETVHLDDVAGQVAFTMQVVEALLASRELTFRHTTRAYAYFKRAEDAPVLDDYCRNHGVSLPVIVSQSDICREDLLFELELDAAGG